MSPTEFTTEDRHMLETLTSIEEDFRIIGEAAPLWTALAKARGQFRPIEKNRKNPHFKSEYADLGEIYSATNPALAEYELALTCPFSRTRDGRATVRAIVGHSSGARLESSASWDASKQSWHELGSARTYITRYLVSGVLAVAADDDDDGNAAVGKPAASEPSRQEPQKVRQQNQTRPSATKEQLGSQRGGSVSVGIASQLDAPKTRPEPSSGQPRASAAELAIALGPTLPQKGSPETEALGKLAEALGPAMSPEQDERLRVLCRSRGLRTVGAITRFARDVIGPDFPGCLEKLGGAALCEKLIQAVEGLNPADVAKSLALEPEVAKP